MEFGEAEATDVASKPKPVELVPSDQQLLDFDQSQDTSEPVQHRSQLPDKIDMVVEVVNANEWLTALQFLDLKYNYTMPLMSKCWYATFKMSPNTTVILTRTYTAGSFHSASLLEDVLRLFTPRVVFAIGCAFGIVGEVGDVLLSKYIAGYEAVREGIDQHGAEQKENRNRPVAMDDGLWKAFASLSQWSLYRKDAGGRIAQVHCHSGALLCGEKLMDNPEKLASTIGIIASRHSGAKGSLLHGEDIIGGEMEGTGIGTVCLKFRNIPCAVIKGKSDGGDGTKNFDSNHEKDTFKNETPHLDDEKAKAKAKKISQRQASYSAWHLVQTFVIDSFHAIQHRVPSKDSPEQQLTISSSHVLFPEVKNFVACSKEFEKHERSHKEAVLDAEKARPVVPSALLQAVEDAKQALAQSEAEIEAFIRQHPVSTPPEPKELERARDAKQQATSILSEKLLSFLKEPSQKLAPLLLTLRNAHGSQLEIDCHFPPQRPRDLYLRQAERYMDPWTFHRMMEDSQHLKASNVHDVKLSFRDPSHATSAAARKRTRSAGMFSQATAAISGSDSFDQTSYEAEQWIPVSDSTMIRDYKYEPETRKLLFHYKNGSQGLLEQITEDQFEDFEAADSKGGWIRQRLPKRPKLS